MKVATILIAALFCSAASVQVQQSSDAIGIGKVIDLLRDMKAQVAKEATEDQTAYDKYACWCETGKKQKTEAIDIANERISELEAFMEEADGLIAQLLTEIEGLKQDQADDKASLATATALREKENAEFEAEKADMTETIDLLGQALEVLAKVQLLQKQGAKAKAQPLLLQLNHIVKTVQPRMTQFKSVMQKDFWDVMSSFGGDGKFLSALSTKLLPWEKEEEQVGKEAKPNELKGLAANAKSYNSRSGSIFGILSQMKDEFVDNLAKAEKAEADAVAAFEKMKAAKLAEIQAAHDQQFAKEQEVSATQKRKAEASGDLEATKHALESDQRILLTLEKDCKDAEEKYADRVKVRSKELVALDETIKILTEDDTRNLFGKTLGLGKAQTQTASFLQLDNERSSGKSVTALDRSRLRRGRMFAMQKARSRARDGAMKRILGVAHKHKNWILASLAVQVKLDSFTKVKEAMDRMTEELKKQQQAEYEKWEYCKKSIDKTEDEIKVKNNEKDDLDEKKQMLENSISTLENDIKELKEAVAEMEVSLKQAGEQRKEENQLYQETVADQRATITILQKAEARMQKFYAAQFAQVSKKDEPSTEPGAALAAPPPTPKGYEKNDSAGGVMQLLAKIVSDATAEESEMVLSENNSQEDYAAFAADTTAAIEANRASILEKTKLSEEAKGSLAETEEALLSTKDAIASLEETLKGFHLDCDYLLKYFDVRQKARAEEMEAIVEAKAILSGADFGTAMAEGDDAAIEVSSA